jgi:hypothetical protein
MLQKGLCPLKTTFVAIMIEADEKTGTAEE